MFGRAKRQPEAEVKLRCSFCNRGEDELRKLIAGPTVFICDECVHVCVDILTGEPHIRRDKASEGAAIASKPPAKSWPTSSAWCVVCGEMADLESAVQIGKAARLCAACVQVVAEAVNDRRKEKGTTE